MNKEKIDESKFFQWSKTYQFRQSCDSIMHPREPKNTVIPNYQGFLPQIVSSSMIGRSTSELSKEAFFNLKPANSLNLASTGLNIHRIQRGDLDPTLHASTYQYGVPTIQKPHPCMSYGTQSVFSNYKQHYKAPQSLPQPTHRETGQVSNNPNIKKSGFTSNNQEFDGKGFARYTDNSQVITQYRHDYNHEYPLQRQTTVFKPRYLPKIAN